jgi:glycosyltransferase involved in cell wall biosynthesis
MPEVTGPFAIYVDPNDRQTLVNGLNALVEDQAFRQKVVKSGAERARGFSWDDSVERILESLFVARGLSSSSL